MRHAALALVVLGPAVLTSCASPSRQPVETEREDAELYEPNVREWVGALEAGMARARLDLARRSVMRAIEAPG